MEAREDTRYRFGPLERMGFMLGLRVPQLAGMVVALLIGLAFLNAGGWGGLLAAFAVVTAASGVFLRRFAGTRWRSGRRWRSAFSSGASRAARAFARSSRRSGTSSVSPTAGCSPRRLASPRRCHRSWPSSSSSRAS